MAWELRRAALQTTVFGCFAAATVACAYEAGITIFSPLEATEQPVHSNTGSGLLATLQNSNPPEFAPIAVLASPLFLATRTPVRSPAPIPEPVAEAPIAAVIPAVDSAPPDYILAGVMISSAERKVLLRKHTNERGLWIKHGNSTADGWVVLTVGSERVTLTRDQKEFGLSLRSSTKMR